MAPLRSLQTKNERGKKKFHVGKCIKIGWSLGLAELSSSTQVKKEERQITVVLWYEILRWCRAVGGQVEVGQKIWIRELPKSTTATRPSGSTVTLVGRSNCPGAEPVSPNFATTCPLECMTTMRLFRVSATIKLPM